MVCILHNQFAEIQIFPLLCLLYNKERMEKEYYLKENILHRPNIILYYPHL